MRQALWLLALQGAMGAFDTIYYHELRARLPARARLGTRRELWLHAVRAVIYAALFGALPHFAFGGAYAIAIMVLLAAEIVITLCDFAIEDEVRRPFGGLPVGERVTHASMGIVYGAMLAHLLPELVTAARTPTAVALSTAPIPDALRWVLVAMSAGVLASGLRDLTAAMGARRAAWPWRMEGAAS